MNSVDIPSLLSAFPKQRGSLPEDYHEIYHEHYMHNRSSKGVVGSIAHRLEGWMHIRAAGDIKGLKEDYSTLEVGAGTLNHLAYERTGLVYDIVEPYRELYAGSIHLEKIRFLYDDIAQVRGRYDRIISIATFEHLLDLPAVMARCGLLLNPGGTLRVAVPAEGSILWKLAYTFSTGLVFYLKHGLSYEVLMRFEHINTWQEIYALAGYFFADVDMSYLGFSPGLSLYHFYQCRQPFLNRCQKVAQKGGGVPPAGRSCIPGEKVHT